MNLYIYINVLEDVTKRVDIRYFNNYEQMESLLKADVDSFPKIINENLVQVNKIFNHYLNDKFQVKVKRRSVMLDKPIHIGFTVLEIRYKYYK